MLGGALAVGICYLVLGWAKEIVAYFVEDVERVWYYSINLFGGEVMRLIKNRDDSMQLVLLSLISTSWTS